MARKGAMVGVEGAARRYVRRGMVMESRSTIIWALLFLCVLCFCGLGGLQSFTDCGSQPPREPQAARRGGAVVSPISARPLA